MHWEFGVSRCKLLYLEWISNEILLYSTGDYIWSLVMNMMENNLRKKNIYILFSNVIYPMRLDIVPCAIQQDLIA